MMNYGFDKKQRISKQVIPTSSAAAGTCHKDPLCQGTNPRLPGGLGRLVSVLEASGPFSHLLEANSKTNKHME